MRAKIAFAKLKRKKGSGSNEGIKETHFVCGDSVGTGIPCREAISKMNANDIRTLNERIQVQMLNSQTIGEQEAGFKSLLLSLLSELAAQTAEVNEKWSILLNPPLMVEYNKSKIDPADWPDLPQPVSFTVLEPRATLRDQFAMAAMQGILARPLAGYRPSRDELAKDAYFYADGMLEDRNAK